MRNVPALPIVQKVDPSRAPSAGLKEGGLFVLEHGKQNNFEDHPHFIERRVYGSVNFSLFR